MSLPISSSAEVPSYTERQPVPAHLAVTAKTGDKKTGDASKADAKTDGGFSFLDFLDIVNPLQHIPVVSSIYREITGDTIKGPARVIGGALYGGPIGAILGGVNAVVASENNGKDVGELAMNKIGIGSKDKPAAPETKVADASKKSDEKIPVVEVRPLANKSPYAAIKSADIIWDAAPKQMAALPEAKTLNDLQPVAGFDPAFDNKAAPKDAGAQALNNIEPGTPSEELPTESVAAVDKAMNKLAAASASADAPAAPIDTNQIPSQMMSALSKYQTMQNISDKAVISPKIAAATPGVTPTGAVAALPAPTLVAPTTRPYASLDPKIRRVSSN